MLKLQHKKEKKCRVTEYLLKSQIAEFHKQALTINPRLCQEHCIFYITMATQQYCDHNDKPQMM